MSDALKTDKGSTREINEDYIAFISNDQGHKLYILCDGMGGYKGGEVASSECAKYIKNKFKTAKYLNVDEAKQWLFKTILLANKKIRNLANSKDGLSKMGTTLVCLLITSEFKIYANVGDSRVYSYNRKELKQLSEDQTFANALLKAGYISEKEAEIHPKKNLLLCAIGSSDEDLDIQIKEINDDNYLMCSDGLYNMVTNKDIAKVVHSEMDIDTKATKLIELANENGGKDNVSVILVEDKL